MGATERYLRLIKLGQRAFGHARLERALRLFAAAENEAKNCGDRELQDRAFCSRCAVLLELDRLDGSVGELKHVLMRSRDPFTSWMAAYYTAQAFEAEGNIARALAYAKRAAELAQSCGERRAIKASANMAGVLALKDSRFAEARELLSDAVRLAAEDGEDVVNLAIGRDNLGYCMMCTDAAAEGMALCRDAAAAIETAGARQFLPEVFSDLCYGALQLGDFAAARGYGQRALALAAEFNHPTVERNTLMLLADAALDEGDEASAEDYLGSLSAHYPDSRGMMGFLRAFNVRNVINLKA